MLKLFTSIIMVSSWMGDIKMYLLNVSALAISMSHIDMILKIILLVFSIGYTAQRWWMLNKEATKKNED
jgi:hypothetical protein|tara:strand:- start:2035 stop:2241 length:207 start_codon:yes stop_codon:yes gene_type:complete